MKSHTVDATVPVGYVSLVRDNRRFRLLWLGQVISLLGDWFNLIASASLIAELSQSGLAIGGLFVVRMLAPFLVSPAAGIVADRYNRKQILILTDVLRAITVLGFLLVREPRDIWLLYTLTAIQMGTSGFFFPTRNAILPELVESKELGAANALSSATWSVMLAMGAALGGLVAGTWGNQPAFVVDALTFAASAALIFQIRYRPSEGLGTADKSIRAALRQYLDGLRYLQRNRDTLVIALHKAAASLLVSSGFQVIQVKISEEIFIIGEGGGIGLGLIYGVVGIGTGVGPIVARKFTQDRDGPLRIAIVFGYLVSAVGLLIASPLQAFGVVLVGTVLRGIGVGVIWVFSTQLLLQRLPNHVRGRVFATEYAIFTLMSASGAAVVGKALDSLELSGILLTMAILTLTPGILWSVWLVRNKKVQDLALETREDNVVASEVMATVTYADNPDP